MQRHKLTSERTDLLLVVLVTSVFKGKAQLSESAPYMFYGKVLLMAQKNVLKGHLKAGRPINCVTHSSGI